jgi:hypothetical protein
MDGQGSGRWVSMLSSFNGLLVSLWNAVLRGILKLDLASRGNGTVMDWLLMLPCMEG